MLLDFKGPKTLVRLGRYDGPLEEAVGKFGEQLEKVPFGLGNTVKYAIFKECEECEASYLLMVSQQKDKIPDPVTGHNVMLTVTSRSYERNQQIARKFAEEAEIPLDLEVPEQLKRTEAMDAAFLVFEKYPKEAMASLQ